ncbi:MAG: hypothetical protein LC100_10370, partial [Chitinophagales bacterium]|nr:hypothetical protein [Chitinophagales bacterium]
MRKQKFSWGFCFSIIRPVDISVWIPHQVQNDNHPKKAKSLWTPIRNLVYHPDEIPCQARDDIGKVMRFRIRHGMTTLLVVGE